MNAIRSLAPPIVTGGAAIAASYNPTALTVVAGLCLLIYLGVVLPAVFFRDPDRRRDARAVLQLIFNFLRRSRAP